MSSEKTQERKKQNRKQISGMSTFNVNFLEIPNSHKLRNLHSQETKNKIKNSLKGKKKTKEHIDNMIKSIKVKLKDKPPEKQEKIRAVKTKAGSKGGKISAEKDREIGYTKITDARETKNLYKIMNYTEEEKEQARQIEKERKRKH